MLTGGGADTVGPGIATRRRRRREQMEEDDSSDLSDESEDDTDQRAAQQIKFAKMPVRHRAGSSPTQTGSRHTPTPGTTSPRAPRRGSHSTMRTRRDTVTSSEVSSENEFDSISSSAAQKHKEAARAAARAVRLQEKIQEEPSPGVRRASTNLLPEEEEDDSDEGSDISAGYVDSLDSASILDTVEGPPINASPTRPVVGTPPKNFTRQSTIRKSQVPAKLAVLAALPPPRPMSTIRPASVVPHKSLLSAAFKAKEHKNSIPFQKYAHYSGQGTKGSLAVRIYAAFSSTPSKPFELLIQPRVRDSQGQDRQVTVADLIGLSLYRYNEEKRQPPLDPKKLNINWFMLRMVEEGGEVDDDFPAFERAKALTSFTTVNNQQSRGGGRMRSNSTAYDDFALVAATKYEYEENKKLTPEEDEVEEEARVSQDSTLDRNATGGATSPFPQLSTELPPTRPRQNPIVNSAYRANAILADAPQARAPTPNVSRGKQRLLRIHILSSDVAPGQMLTLDVTTDTYLAEVLDMVCRKRQLDKGNHVLKLPGSGAVVMLDRPVSSIGNVSDLELFRRRFATDGPLTLSGSPGSTSPKAMQLSSPQEQRKLKKTQLLGPHPLAREAIKTDELGDANYKKYTVWRKGRIVGLSERILVIDGEYIHIMPSSNGKAIHDGSGKTTTVHFSNVVGCKVPRKHPTCVKVRSHILYFFGIHFTL